MMNEAIEPFLLAIAQHELDELRDRLVRTRWPEREPLNELNDWSQGAPLERVKSLCEYWRTRYDWRRCEAMLNGWGQYRTSIDGLGIHFLHIRSHEPDALPLIMTHGWPGSVIEFNKVIGPLTDPVSYGGSARDAFHLILPSLPGYGFSDKPAVTGWGIKRIADAWIVLMDRLGYARYGAQGGDWGAPIAKAIGKRRPPGCVGIHINIPLILPSPQEIADASPKEREYLDTMQDFHEHESGYGIQQSTRPQTLGYALADSPVGQAAWIYEKFQAWSDVAALPGQAFTLDEMLDNIMLYWLTNSGASSARLYRESWAEAFVSETLTLPVGVSIFPREKFLATRRWAERYFRNIVHWNELERGGHFAAFEQPTLFVTEVRSSFRSLR